MCAIISAIDEQNKQLPEKKLSTVITPETIQGVIDAYKNNFNIDVQNVEMKYMEYAMLLIENVESNNYEADV